MRTALAALLAVLAVAGLGAAARDHRPAPFGDAVAVRAADLPAAAGALLLGSDGIHGPDASVQLRDTATGRTAWSYRRPGSRPLRLYPLAAGTTAALWDDGMLTGIRSDAPDGPRVSWHRFVPGLADWLRRPRAAGTPLLVPLDGGTAFLLPTPQLVMAYTSADGSIRADTLPPAGCAYDPSRALALAGLVVLPRPCDEHSTVEAFDQDGRRWQAPAGPSARPVRADPGTVGVLDVPLLRPRILLRGTGRTAVLTGPVSTPPALNGGGAAPNPG
ncbi:hypothetical protein ACEZCY_31330 [Streptacidiphilus sp. N1-12]|uniref:Uncharacterized protein n=2 Tax=Streptacidiphilus alkalitolerans TaxID=3342712 RepID=A0ABV6WNQ4_9ACTN